LTIEFFIEFEGDKWPPEYYYAPLRRLSPYSWVRELRYIGRVVFFTVGGSSFRSFSLVKDGDALVLICMWRAF
jgi:hypothetical protein